MSRKAINLSPAFLLLLCGIAGAAVALCCNPGERFYAWFILAAFLVLAWVDVYFSLLVFLFLTQFFMGDFFRPYMFLSTACGLIFSVAWLIKTVVSRDKVKFPQGWLFVPYLAVLAVSFPLNLKEVLLDFEVLGLKGFASSVAVATTFSREFWLRELFGNFVSFMIFLSAYNVMRERKGFEKGIWLALVSSLACASAGGLVLLYNWVPYEGRFLSINFADSPFFRGMLTSFGWSVTFFAEYFAATFPFLFALVFAAKGRWKKLGVFALILVALFAAMKTYRRMVFVVGGLEIVFLAVSAFVIRARRRSSNSSLRPLKGVAVALAVMTTLGIVFYLFLGVSEYAPGNIRGEIRAKYSLRGLMEDPRISTHLLCFHMLGHAPILGLGPGGYTQNFFKLGGGTYLNRYNVELQDGRVLNKLQGSPHSLYLKIFIENGILGLLAFLWMVGGVAIYVLKSAKKIEPSTRLFFLALLSGFFGILFYGFFMDIFWAPATRILFWVYLAMLLVETEPVVPEIRVSKRGILVGVFIFVSLFAFRLYRIKKEPISSNYEAGFYRWKATKREGEWGRFYRLTSGHALKVLTIHKGMITFWLCSNKPDVARNPQTVNIYFDGKLRKTVRVNDTRWRKVVIPVKGMVKKRIFMDFQVGGTWIPYQYGKGKSHRVLGIIVSKIQS